MPITLLNMLENFVPTTTLSLTVRDVWIILDGPGRVRFPNFQLPPKQAHLCGWKSTLLLANKGAYNYKAQLKKLKNYIGPLFLRRPIYKMHLYASENPPFYTRAPCSELITRKYIYIKNNRKKYCIIIY